MIVEVQSQTTNNIEIEKIIEGFLNEFDLTQSPIEVSFRALLPMLRKTDRHSHLIHTYPAKLLLHIPYFFLNNNCFSKPGDIVLDPFCGTGTVLLEAILANRNAVGADANPLAQLIARVKVRTYSKPDLTRFLDEIVTNISSKNQSNLPKVVNLKFWFNESTINNLLQILGSINKIEVEEIRDFFLVCFSNLVKKVSYADPRISVPVRLNANRYEENSANYQLVSKRLKDLESINPLEKFLAICNENIKRVTEQSAFLQHNNFQSNASIISHDARNLTENLSSKNKQPNETIDLVITSPPYAGAQKYIRSSSLSLGWLGLASSEELRNLDKNNIGRENYTKAERTLAPTNIIECDQLIEKIKEINPLRAHIVSNYINEMQLALGESIRVLKKTGYLIIIIGNNKVCGYEFNTQHYLTEYIISLGLTLKLKLIDDIKSYGLMTKRNKTADIISREYILIFQK
ncbi:DNA methyltransferase [Pedobacter sp. CFBP9032]|uniref:DNA methyltransferase n=1 Tax=Pedobacter sp. CFBP9032 TaxID=3096539 RepID=UPI002A6ACB9E|nr:DNA methyltransferase [Pedobacter sp. CFBP9032]MDY0903891.1 DNA methyltransferase [Pedobacter sp. CFBP9032]